ncbi:DVU_1557 family redox protein [Desulfomicrobium escambiense]|jgi:hypothetical protein|uniref:DVU_1557 family redox protein n=1 Tax=Desulfomicrobium escambiense TaxID=29503 RepID=UPI00040909A7|nr:CLJU_RS11820 family redox protein [Desulfomicrobium escambiense]
MSLVFMPEDMDWVCEPCGERLQSGKVELDYLGNAFHVELPVCPKCGAVYIYEELALGRIHEVEQLLEDK